MMLSSCDRIAESQESASVDVVRLEDLIDSRMRGGRGGGEHFELIHFEFARRLNQIAKRSRIPVFLGEERKESNKSAASP